MSLVVAVLVLLGKFAPMDHAITSRHLHDLGKLMLAMVMIWAYLSFSQYLIIYSGNLPQEITWYVRRLNGGWQWVGLVLLLFHFALPFALLLSQSLKRNPNTISAIAIFIICIRVIDVFWLVEPNFVDVIIRSSRSPGWILSRRSASAGCGWQCFSELDRRGRCCRWALRIFKRH